MHGVLGLLAAIGVAILYALYHRSKRSVDTVSQINLIDDIRKNPSKGVDLSYGLQTPVIRKSMPPGRAQVVLLKLSEIKNLKSFIFNHVQLIDQYTLLLITSFEYAAVQHTRINLDRGQDDIAYHYFVLRYNPDASLMQVTTNAHNNDEETRQKNAFGKILSDMMEGR